MSKKNTEAILPSFCSYSGTHQKKETALGKQLKHTWFALSVKCTDE